VCAYKTWTKKNSGTNFSKETYKRMCVNENLKNLLLIFSKFMYNYQYQGGSGDQRSN